MVQVITDDIANKLKILSCLSTEKKTWRDIQKETRLSTRTIGKHLKRLLDEGLITVEVDEKDRRIKYYKINDKGLKSLVDDLLSIHITFQLKEEEWDILKEGRKISEPKKHQEFLINEVRNLVGNVYLTGLVRGDRTADIVINALRFYSRLTEAQLWVNVDKRFEHASSEMFDVKDVKELLVYVTVVLKGLCKNAKVVEKILTSEDYLKRFHELEKKRFPEQTFELTVAELEDQLDRLKRFLNTVKENPILNPILTKMEEDLKITEKDVEEFFEKHSSG